MTPPESAARALPQPSALKLRLTFTELDATELGFLDRWRATLKRRTERKARLESTVARFRAGLEELIQVATAEHLTKKFTGRRLAGIRCVTDSATVTPVRLCRSHNS